MPAAADASLEAVARLSRCRIGTPLPATPNPRRSVGRRPYGARWQQLGELAGGDSLQRSHAGSTALPPLVCDSKVECVCHQKSLAGRRLCWGACRAKLLGTPSYSFDRLNRSQKSAPRPTFWTAPFPGGEITLLAVSS